jgi:hypothetical protein
VRTSPQSARDPGLADSFGHALVTRHRGKPIRRRLPSWFPSSDWKASDRPTGAVRRVADALTGRWLTAKWSDGPGFGYAFTGQAGATITMIFRGTGFTWNAFVGPNDGQTQVSIDGSIVNTPDLYAPSYSFQDFTYGGLADTFHTFRITVLGTHDASSSDNIVTAQQLTIH